METRRLGRSTTVLFGERHGQYPDGNSVLVEGSAASVLIDPSLSVHAADPPLTVDRVLLTHTHEDHAAGVGAVRWDELSVHDDDLAALRSVDGLMALYGVPDENVPMMTELVTTRFHFAGWPEASGFRDGATWELGGVTVRAVHAPGHTGGHCVFVVEPDGVVVTGDIDLSSFGPYYGDRASSLDQFESTLTAVRDIEARHYVTFHHKGVIDGHAAFAAAVDGYSAAIARRHDALVALLATPRTFDELVEVGIVYRPGTRPGVFGESVERYSVRRHLDRLLADGGVATDGQQYWRR